MKSTENPDTAASVETLRGLWPSTRAAKEAKTDPAAREKAWKTAIDAARQASRLVANAGEYGAAVADDPAKLFRAAREEAQAAVNQLLASGEKPVTEYAHEAVSAIKKSDVSWDWSAVPKAKLEGPGCQFESARPPVSVSPDGLKIVYVSIDPADSPGENYRKVKLDKYLDLTDPAVQAQLKVNTKALLADETMIWQIGREAYMAGFNGLITPLAGSAGGKVIMAFGGL